MIGAPTYPMLRDSTFKSFRETLDRHELPYEFLQSVFSVVLLEPDSRIWFRALDKFERIRGTHRAWVSVSTSSHTASRNPGCG